MLGLFKQYPAGNDPKSSADLGLNFNILRFNAPQKLDNRAYVARMDFNLDTAGKHTLMLRGTLAGNSTDSTLAQFPGQDAVAKTLDNSRGLAARYTTVISPHMVNVVGYGYTRLGTASTGNSPSTRPSTSRRCSRRRALARVSPTNNRRFHLDAGRHTAQFGTNMRFIENDRTAFNNVPSYSFSRNTLLGLGGDITANVLSLMQSRYGGREALLRDQRDQRDGRAVRPHQPVQRHL